MVVLHIDVGLPNTNVQDHTLGRDITITYYLYTYATSLYKRYMATFLDVAWVTGYIMGYIKYISRKIYNVKLLHVSK